MATPPDISRMIDSLLVQDAMLQLAKGTPVATVRSALAVTATPAALAAFDGNAPMVSAGPVVAGARKLGMASRQRRVATKVGRFGLIASLGAGAVVFSWAHGLAWVPGVVILLSRLLAVLSDP